MVSNWVYFCLATLVFCGVTVNRLPGSGVMVCSWQMLCGGRSAPVMVEIVSCMWLKYIHFVLQLESAGNFLNR